MINVYGQLDYRELLGKLVKHTLGGPERCDFGHWIWALALSSPVLLPCHHEQSRSDPSHFLPWCFCLEPGCHRPNPLKLWVNTQFMSGVWFQQWKPSIALYFWILLFPFILSFPHCFITFFLTTIAILSTLQQEPKNKQTKKVTFLVGLPVSLKCGLFLFFETGWEPQSYHCIWPVRSALWKYTKYYKICRIKFL